VDEILKEIISDDMTQVDKARAIHSWIRRNVGYAASLGGPESIYEGAHRALTDRRGNCYIYYSIGEVMLTQAGIPNMKIQRDRSIPGTTHLWSIINPDELGWYHFDATPMTSSLGFNSLTYMFTDTDAARFAAAYTERHGAPTYYTYDRDLYPEIEK